MSDYIVLLTLLLIAYTYFGYPLLLRVWPKKYPLPDSQLSSFPSLTVMIAAYNEENAITATIQSFLKSNYPKEKLNILVVSDASSDNTDRIVLAMQHERVQLIRSPLRMGKFEVLKTHFSESQGRIVVFADASGQFHPDAIRKMVRHFRNPSVGSVTGRKLIMQTGSSVSKGDGLYWRYESGLRRMESLTGASWVGCEGGITAIRRDLMVFDYPSWIAQDYALCCRIYEQGYRNIYDPEAVVLEPPSKRMAKEFSRKVRVIVRGIQAFFYFHSLLNPIRHPMFSFQNISHRLMRWLVPFFLILLLYASATSRTGVVTVFFFTQILFYGIGAYGLLTDQIKSTSQPQVWFLSVPQYFISMNIAAFFSWLILFKRFGVWKRTERDESV